MLFSVDWIVSDMLAVRQGCIGRLRYILKNELKMIPLYGFYFYEVNMVKMLSVTFVIWGESDIAIHPLPI